MQQPVSKQYINFAQFPTNASWACAIKKPFSLPFALPGQLRRVSTNIVVLNFSNRIDTLNFAHHIPVTTEALPTLNLIKLGTTLNPPEH